MPSRLSKILWAFSAVIVLALGGWGSAAAAQAKPDDQAQLIERVKEAVIKELRDSGVLDKEIDAGIHRFIVREQAARQARQQAAAEQKAAKVQPVSAQHDHIFGNPDAPISLIEYSDFECPFCKRFHPIARRLVESSGGKVNWVYRDFPLNFHNPAAEREAEAAECVAALGGNDAFWNYSDLLYANTTSNGHGVPVAQLGPLAASVGVDKESFEACLKSHRYAARVKRDVSEGEAIGIDGTPGNILRNNRTGAVRVRPGVRPLASLKADVDAMLQ